MKRVATVSLLLALAACRQPTQPAEPGPAAQADAEVRLAAIEGRLDLLERLLAGRQGLGGDGDGSSEPLPADDAARLARLEARFDRLMGFMRQAVPAELDTSKMYAIPVDPRDPVLGPAGAPVTVVEVFEFLCPYCSMIEPTLGQLRARYPDKVRVVSKYLVIHGPPAIPSGLGACAAGRQGKADAYWRDTWAAIWPSSGEVDREAAAADAVEARARKLGLDLARFRKDVAESGPCQAWLEDTASVAERFGVSGTPTVFINGRLVATRDLDDLGAAVDAELARVAASKVPPARYYQDVVLAKGEQAAVMVSPFD